MNEPLLEQEPRPLRETESGVTGYPPAPRPQTVVRSFYIPLTRLRLTYFFIIVNLLMFIATLWHGYRAYGDMNGAENGLVLIDMGAKVNELIAVGETWRLFTAMFLHIGILHLLFNLYALHAVGSLVEPYFGQVRFAVIYLLGGLFGSLASYAFSDSLSAGASGAVFAVMAAAAVYFFRYRDNFGDHGRALLQNIVVILVINLSFGFMGTGIDNWGHLGGLAGGALLAWALLPRYRLPTPAEFQITSGRASMITEHRTGLETLAVFAVLLLFAAGVYLTTQMYLNG